MRSAPRVVFFTPRHALVTILKQAGGGARCAIATLAGSTRSPAAHPRYPSMIAVIGNVIVALLAVSLFTATVRLSK